MKKGFFGIFVLCAVLASLVLGADKKFPTATSITATRNLSSTTISSGQSITATFSLTNSNGSTLNGFFYSENIPSSASITSTSVQVNGATVSVNPTTSTSIYTGMRTYTWVIQAPSAYAGARTVNASGGKVDITYRISGINASVNIEGYAWAGKLGAETGASSNCVFGYCDPVPIVFTETVPPTISSAAALSGTQVRVNFSEPLDNATATNAANYTISGGVSVSGAALSSNVVTLTTSALTKDVTYTLTVNNVKDLAGNTIAANSTRNFVYTDSWKDDFSDGNYTANPTWTVGNGSWSVASGVLRASGGTAVSIYGGDANWDDITFTASVKPTSSGKDVWLIFRVQDANNYYLYTLQSGKLYKYQNAGYTELASGSGTYTQGTAYNMKVELSGTSIKIYRNGTQVLSHTDGTFTKGKVGFGGNGGATGDFDNVEVTFAGSVGNITDRFRPDINSLNLRLMPNPMTAFTPVHVLYDGTEAIKGIALYDMAGNLVNNLEITDRQIKWNGTDLNGQAVAAGTYIAKFRIGNNVVSRNLMLIR